MSDESTLEAIVREFKRRMQRAGENLDLAVYVAEDHDGWRIDGHLHTCTRGRWSERHASVDVSAREFFVVRRHGDRQALDFVDEHIRRLERLLRDEPRPTFRIGTRHHPKRLVPRAA